MLANQLDSVCKILDISIDDVDSTDVLTILFAHAENALMLLIGEHQVPKQLEWIINEVVVKRYQQLGAEHLQSESIDSISNTFVQGDLLSDYLPYINAYIANNAEEKPESSIRRVKFY